MTRSTFAVLSSEAVMRLLPSGEKLTHRTVPVCALRMVERPSLRQCVMCTTGRHVLESCTGRHVLESLNTFSSQLGAR